MQDHMVVWYSSMLEITKCLQMPIKVQMHLLYTNTCSSKKKELFWNSVILE